MRHDLVRRFSEADLDLRILRGPLQNGNREIFQIDILRTLSREEFRLWPGGDGNRIEAPSVDRDLRQAVMLVQEPVRTFRERVDRVRLPDGRSLPPVLGRDERIIERGDLHWMVERRTPGTLRRFLCGMDERHLFIAQFRDGRTVREAHASLRPPEVESAERRAPGQTIRQGEWFFVPLERGEREFLDDYVRRMPRSVFLRAPVGPGPRPHVADEVVHRGEAFGFKIGRRLGRFRGRLRTYARGAVRHPDHATVRLDAWRRVVPNLELTVRQRGENGVFWID